MGNECMGKAPVVRVHVLVLPSVRLISTQMEIGHNSLVIVWLGWLICFCTMTAFNPNSLINQSPHLLSSATMMNPAEPDSKFKGC